MYPGALSIPRGWEGTRTEPSFGVTIADTLAPLEKPIPEWSLGDGTEQRQKRPLYEPLQGRSRIRLPTLPELVPGPLRLPTPPSRASAISPSPRAASSPRSEHGQRDRPAYLSANATMINCLRL
jgi:hypothetical protein